MRQPDRRFAVLIITVSMIMLTVEAIVLAPATAREQTATVPAADSKESPESAEDTSLPEQSLPKLAASLKSSLVVVKATGRDGRDYGHGTGFVISKDGLVVTARHVIGDRRPVRVELSDGTSLPVTHVHASTEVLDLVVLRVNADDLNPLDLGDSNTVSVGQSIVVAGHPQGIKDSVFSGILSGHHEIDGVSMLQLSVTVEPGSSGEPVVDRSGRVLGIVTMKNTRQSNLGYALPVKHLQALLEDPSPIPIERWMTIGALDPVQWTVIWDANWRQRASRILVDGYGESFGGRSLCLKPQPPESAPFEIQVDVRLDNESGAAGLVFHSDEGDRHYGFYPSAGKLRVTRFNGPDVNSWTILHNESHPAYRSEEWNTLRVRADGSRFSCFVNDQPVVELQDSALPAGKVGLGVYRGTSASFRRFLTGSTIPSSRPAGEQLTAIHSILDKLPASRPAPADIVEELLPLASGVGSVLEDRARLLELKAKRLRQLADDVHAATVRRRLLSALALPLPGAAEADGNPVAAIDASVESTANDVEITRTNADEGDKGSRQRDDAQNKSPDLLHAALLIAVLDNEEVEPDDYIHRVDLLAAEIRRNLPENAAEADQLAALDDLLFRDYGFRGSRFEYYTKSNSYLNEVIDDREGLPITLSVLYIELAKRLGLNVVGLGLPGHYVVRFEPQDGTESQIIDVFNRGQRLSQAEAESLIRSRGFPVRKEFFESQNAVQIVERMLLNLLNLAEGRRDDEQVLKYLETLTALDAGSMEYRAKRLEMRARTDRLQEAIDDADWFIKRDPQNADRLYELRAQLQRALDAVENTAD
ncbi:MAG: trypsin-like peptidase domain-containing protein [Planctomycetaceae bacterium]|nr:trypsin-like peptidase domain-containing protein [Planctomycetaceae bacterium]